MALFLMCPDTNIINNGLSCLGGDRDTKMVAGLNSVTEMMHHEMSAEGTSAR